MKLLARALLAAAALLALAAIWIPAYWAQLLSSALLALFVGAAILGPKPKAQADPGVRGSESLETPTPTDSAR